MDITKIKINKIGKYYKMLLGYENPFNFLFAVFLSATKLSKFITIKREGYKLIFHPSAISINYYLNKKARSFDEDILSKLLKENDTYVDVGANIGALALKAKSIVNDGKVVAIEAHPKTFSYLKSNFDLNNFENYVLLNKGAGDKSGTIQFSDSNSDDQNHVVTTGGIEVEIDTLDNILRGVEKVDLLKIDVEGFEKQVLLGSHQTLKVTKNIFIEVFDDNFKRYDYSTKDVLNILNNYGFSFFKVESDFSLQKINNFNSYEAQIVHNLICTKNELELITAFAK